MADDVENIMNIIQVNQNRHQILSTISNGELTENTSATFYDITGSTAVYSLTHTPHKASDDQNNHFLRHIIVKNI